MSLMLVGVMGSRLVLDGGSRLVGVMDGGRRLVGVMDGGRWPRHINRPYVGSAGEFF